ncbi:MAG: DUF92 domain-containing protein, partial [Spirochaetales bacterium]|nr:DUF92 domain-containing protein [Candidatus Physcosoma equi]
YLVLLGGIAFLAKKKRWLTTSGAIGAIVLGLIVLYVKGFSGFAVFLFFFLTCSVVSKVKKTHNNREKKGSVRDLEQVLANGLPAVLCLLFSMILPFGEVAVLGFSAALAEEMADTWSGTLGILSKEPPVSILTFTPVPKGISGGVTLLGFLGGASGALLIALVHLGTLEMSFRSFLIISGTGFLGSVVDSLLGAAFQVQYRAKDGSLTEKEYEGEEKLERVRGIPGFDNDMVNLVCGLFSALAAFSLGLILA